MEHLFPFTTASVAETIDFGRRLGQQLQKHSVIALHGDLGTGKTHLVKGIAASIGIPMDAVASPTFSLINVYETDVLVYHIDLYRIKTERELLELGIEEYLNSAAIVLLEWPEIARPFLPDHTIHILIEHAENDNRVFQIIA